MTKRRRKQKPILSPAEVSWMQRITGRQRARRLSRIQRGMGDEDVGLEYE